MKNPAGWFLFAALAVSPLLPTLHAQTTTTAFGLGPVVLGSVDAFRADLGTLNPNVAGSFGTGRREINWDGVPNGFAAPNPLPADFFNVNSPRGVVLSTPGTGFQVSSSSTSGTPVEFGNINPAYPALFAPFSAERLFTPLGSTITDIQFFVPGTTDAALTRGFGVVFSDVDVLGASSVEFFGAGGASLLKVDAPVSGADERFSFVGVSYLTPMISRIRINSGNEVLSSVVSGRDVVVLDDFIYGEPVRAVSTPDGGATLSLLGASLGILALLRAVRHGRPV